MRQPDQKIKFVLDSAILLVIGLIAGAWLASELYVLGLIGLATSASWLGCAGFRRGACAVVAFGWVASVLLPPSITVVHEITRNASCPNNLRSIALALHQYREDHGAFPPPVVRSPQGKPLCSWRALILPYLEYPKLYEEYDFARPWDAAENASVAKQIPPWFVCPNDVDSAENVFTSYVALLDDDGNWLASPDDEVLLVELVSSRIHWLEPKDALFAPEQLDAGAEPKKYKHEMPEGYLSQVTGGHVASADCRIALLPIHIDGTARRVTATSVHLRSRNITEEEVAKIDPRRLGKAIACTAALVSFVIWSALGQRRERIARRKANDANNAASP